MARVELSRQQVSDVGLSPAYSPAVEDGHMIKNPLATEIGAEKGKLVLHICNINEEPVTVTIRSGYTIGDLKLQDRQVVVPPVSCVFVGPLDPTVYNQPGTSHVYIDYSQTEGVDIAALLIP